ncbi:MAG TPA: TVP38/TMEM64 family protein [Bacillota bacterium]
MYMYTDRFNRQKRISADEIGDYVMQILQDYENLGPLPGFMLPLLEAFLPFLPLFAFVFANAAAYGLAKGFFLSWAGASLGSISVFLIIRKLGRRQLFKTIREHKRVSKVTKWVERNGFGPLFILLCFPFSPSSVINIVAGLSNIRIQQFVLAVLLGKSVMIFSIAYVGSSIRSLAKNPQKAMIIGIFIGIFWLIGKVIETRLQQRSSLIDRVNKSKM